VATLRFEIDGEPPYVAFSTFVTAALKLKQLLRELDQVISGRYGGTLQWYVSSLTSSRNLGIEVLSRVRTSPTRARVPDVSGQVAASLVTGFDNVEHRAISPPYLSEYGLQHLGEMLDVLNKNGARGYTATDVEHARTVTVSRSAAETVRQLLPIRRSTLGSVDGRLEAISIHRRPKFIVYHGLTSKAVTCVFEGSDVMLETVKDILGRRVLVSGTVHSNIKGEPVRIDVADIRILGAENLPTTRELTGSHPDITDGMTAEEYIRSLRQ